MAKKTYLVESYHIIRKGVELQHFKIVFVVVYHIILEAQKSSKTSAKFMVHLDKEIKVSVKLVVK